MTQAQSTPLLFDGTRCRTKLLCVDGTVMHACTFLYQIWVFIFDKRLAMRIALAMQPTLFPQWSLWQYYSPYGQRGTPDPRLVCTTHELSWGGRRKQPYTSLSVGIEQTAEPHRARQSH